VLWPLILADGFGAVHSFATNAGCMQLHKFGKMAQQIKKATTFVYFVR